MATRLETTAIDRVLADFSLTNEDIWLSTAGALSTLKNPQHLSSRVIADITQAYIENQPFNISAADLIRMSGVAGINHHPFLDHVCFNYDGTLPWAADQIPVLADLDNLRKNRLLSCGITERECVYFVAGHHPNTVEKVFGLPIRVLNTITVGGYSRELVAISPSLGWAKVEKIETEFIKDISHLLRPGQMVKAIAYQPDSTARPTVVTKSP